MQRALCAEQFTMTQRGFRVIIFMIAFPDLISPKVSHLQRFWLETFPICEHLSVSIFKVYLLCCIAELDWSA